MRRLKVTDVFGDDGSGEEAAGPPPPPVAGPTESVAPVVYPRRTFYFQQRNGRLDIRRLARLDLDRVVEDVDIDALEVRRAGAAHRRSRALTRPRRSNTWKWSRLASFPRRTWPECPTRRSSSSSESHRCALQLFSRHPTTAALRGGR